MVVYGIKEIRIIKIRNKNRKSEVINHGAKNRTVCLYVAFTPSILQNGGYVAVRGRMFI